MFFMKVVFHPLFTVQPSIQFQFHTDSKQSIISFDQHYFCTRRIALWLWNDRM